MPGWRSQNRRSELRDPAHPSAPVLERLRMQVFCPRGGFVHELKAVRGHPGPDVKVFVPERKVSLVKASDPLEQGAA